LFLAASFCLHAADPAAEAPDPARWGPLSVGDYVGLKEVGVFYDLLLFPEGQQASAYRLRRIIRSEGSTFLVVSPPAEGLYPPALVKEIWIATGAVRSVRIMPGR
jgi:hypothetical protein